MKFDIIKKADRDGHTKHAALESIHASMVRNARQMAELQDEAHYLAKLAQLRLHQMKNGQWPAKADRTPGRKGAGVDEQALRAAFEAAMSTHPHTYSTVRCAPDPDRDGAVYLYDHVEHAWQGFRLGAGWMNEAAAMTQERKANEARRRASGPPRPDDTTRSHWMGLADSHQKAADDIRALAQEGGGDE